MVKTKIKLTNFVSYGIRGNTKTETVFKQKK